MTSSVWEEIHTVGSLMAGSLKQKENIEEREGGERKLGQRRH